jgi:uncharacterized membrane protein required for colicin V production
VDISAFLRSQNVFDLLVVLIMAAAFILGYIQGTIRRLLGIASILFSFLLAAQLREPLGNYFASNWHQFPAEYSLMIAFGAVFVAASVVFSLLIQGFYKRSPLFAKANFLDELLGGVLGVLQALLILGALIVITDTFFTIPGMPTSNNELPFIRSFHDALDPSGTAKLFRDVLIPAFFWLVGAFIPPGIKSFFS